MTKQLKNQLFQLLKAQGVQDEDLKLFVISPKNIMACVVKVKDKYVEPVTGRMCYKKAEKFIDEYQEHLRNNKEDLRCFNQETK